MLIEREKKELMQKRVPQLKRLRNYRVTKRGRFTKELLFGSLSKYLVKIDSKVKEKKQNQNKKATK